MTPAGMESIVVALITAAPELVDVVIRVATHEKARRVEAVRPETGHGHAETAAEALRTGGPTDPTPAGESAMPDVPAPRRHR